MHHWVDTLHACEYCKESENPNKLSKSTPTEDHQMNSNLHTTTRVCSSMPAHSHIFTLHVC